MSKKRLMWVSRDAGCFKESVIIWRTEPQYSPATLKYSTPDGQEPSVETELCYLAFKQATGLKLKPGECVKVVFSASVVGWPKGKTK